MCVCGGVGGQMAQPQGSFCMCGTNTLRLKTQPVLHRWDEQKSRGHICYPLVVNVQMFSQAFFFMNSNFEGMKEKKDQLINFTHISSVRV